MPHDATWRRGWPLANDAPKTLEGHNFQTRLGFGQGFSRWKALGEHTTMVSSFEDSGSCRKAKKLYPHPLKGYLGGRVCNIHPWSSCYA
jgi:hypothetical protein